MKQFTVGNHLIPSWIIGVIMVALCAGAFAAYLATTFTVPLEVKEPIEVLQYPSSFILYPGDTIYFNVTVQNHAPQTYSVSMNFSLSDNSYKTAYVTFSNDAYHVATGVHTLTAWLQVSETAPPIVTNLSVDVCRIGGFMKTEQLVITSVTFPSSTSAVISVTNTGTNSLTISSVTIDDAPHTAVYGGSIGTDRSLAAGQSGTITITNWTWTSGYKYTFAVLTTSGNKYTYTTNAAP